MLAPWKKSHDKPRQYLKKQRHHFVDKGTYSQSYVVMYGCENWTIKMVECWRIHAFKLWCWRRLESPLVCKEIKPVNPKGNQPWILLEGLMLKFQYFGHLMKETAQWKRPWCWEGRKAKGEGGNRGWDDWMASPTPWTWVWASSRRWWRTGKPDVLQSLGSQRVGHNLATEQKNCTF